MKRIVLIFAVILLQLNALKAQDSVKLYLGLYTAGAIESYSKYITEPYYKNLNYYTLSFIPKVGVEYRHITAGIMGAYTFHTNTLESLESLWGGGYFLKYNFLKKATKKNLDKKFQFDYFVEWRHLVNEGYYVPIQDWRRAKIKTPITYLSLQVGLDIKLPNSWSIALGSGIGSTNFLKNPQDINGEKRFKIKPYGTLTIQHKFKL
jgi:hypothetical protein